MIGSCPAKLRRNSARSRLEQFLPRSDSRFVFVLVMTCYSATVTEIAARVIAFFGFWTVKVDNFQHTRPVRPGVDETNLIDLLFIAPILESLIIIAIIELLRRLKVSVAIQLVTAVLAISLLHGLQYPFVAFLVAPAFLIQAATYLYWRRRSFWIAAQTIVLLHFLCNCIPLFSVLKDQLNKG